MHVDQNPADYEWQSMGGPIFSSGRLPAVMVMTPINNVVFAVTYWLAGYSGLAAAVRVESSIQ